MILRSDEHADIEVPGAPGSMRLHVFRPAVPGRFPGVVLYSEIFQITAPIRRLASVIAGLGYVVAAPEVYHEYEPLGTVLGYDTAGSDRGNALKKIKPIEAFDADADASLAWLATHEACNGLLGTFGVCLGGHLAVRAALNPSVSAMACFYPTDIHAGSLGAEGDTTLARLAELKAHALFVWGRQDPHVPFAGRQVIRARLEEVEASYEWHEVNAAHAFLRDEGPRYDPALFLQGMGWVERHFARWLR
jgi:carboxymethylenebutenolidase